LSVNYGLNKVRFSFAVRAARVRARVTLLSAKLPKKIAGFMKKESASL